MNEIKHEGLVYEYRCSSNNGEVKLYVTMDSSKAVITDRENKILFDVSVNAMNRLSIYQMSI